MAVDLEEVEGFPTDPPKFAILIKDACMAETKMQDDFHDRQCVNGHIGVGHRFHSGRRTHVAGRSMQLDSEKNPRIQSHSWPDNCQCEVP